MITLLQFGETPSENYKKSGISGVNDTATTTNPL